MLLPQAECGPAGSLGLWVQREEFQRPLAQHPSSSRRGCASRGPASTRHPGSGSVRVSAPNSQNNGQVLTINHRLSPHVPRPSHLWAYYGHPHSLQGLCPGLCAHAPRQPPGDSLVLGSLSTSSAMGRRDCSLRAEFPSLCSVFSMEHITL